MCIRYSKSCTHTFTIYSCSSILKYSAHILLLGAKYFLLWYNSKNYNTEQNYMNRKQKIIRQTLSFLFFFSVNELNNLRLLKVIIHWILILYSRNLYKFQTLAGFHLNQVPLSTLQSTFKPINYTGKKKCKSGNYERKEVCFNNVIENANRSH
jgi:hypothetical protein